ncbi:maleylpyruvate isomerase N-terminal domain-containing protein [Nonomuraea candida]|uniref:maleylpyruvate isomerase N-terminal domain-containing protein n=1 Tax=Nonomuraea candida TaxID=359159 RepID=UPI0005B9E338|nr:maleylpyruvate isomerase N-terminal domain-containing protein [Nonomuraea candida]
MTAEDLEEAVRLAVETLRRASGPAAWQARAGSLDWTCWETAEHLADDLFAYAVQLGLTVPPLDVNVPFAMESRTPGGPRNAVRADPAAGVTGLLQVLQSSGALLAAMVRTAPPHARAHHIFGPADASACAAMGLVETLVHVHDLAGGLGLDWTPPARLCARALARLFPGAPGGADPWTTLLWATGRAELPGRRRLTRWCWHNEPPPHQQ